MGLKLGDAMLYLCIEVYVYETILVCSCLLALRNWHKSICEIGDTKGLNTLKQTNLG